jgi:hypothetical protein
MFYTMEWVLPSLAKLGQLRSKVSWSVFVCNYKKKESKLQLQEPKGIETNFDDAGYYNAAFISCRRNRFTQNLHQQESGKRQEENPTFLETTIQAETIRAIGPPVVRAI